MSTPHTLEHIPGLRVHFSAPERQQVLERISTLLETGMISQGKQIDELEERFAAYVHSRFAIAVNSGSGAIEVPMRALQVEGKEVLVPTNTFLATAASVLLAGGKIRLVDADPNTFAVSLAELQKRATPQTAGVVIVHIGGIITPEIEQIRRWCDQEGYWLFEDAAHAHGSFWNDRGAGTFGIAGSYSFFATKVMTSGEGGIIVTDDEQLARKCKLYRNHGKPEPWISYHTHLSSNYRMSDITAAIAQVQLAHLEEKLQQRAHIARLYTELLPRELPSFQPVLPTGPSSWYKYIVLPPPQFERAQIKQYMKEHGVSLPGEVYEMPLHQQPALAPYIDKAEFPQAEYICRQHICLPIYPGLTDEQAQRVVQVLCDASKQI